MLVLVLIRALIFCSSSKVATIILKRLGKIGGSDHQVKTRIRQILSRISKDVDFSIAEVKVRGAELSTRPPIYEVRLEDPDSAVALRKAFALFKKDRIPPELKGIEVFNSVTLATRVRTSILRVRLFGNFSFGDFLFSLFVGLFCLLSFFVSVEGKYLVPFTRVS